jgi:hypothetical protein
LGEQFMADEQSESAKAEQEKAQRERIEKLATTLHFIKLEPYTAGNTKGAQQFPQSTRTELRCAPGAHDMTCTRHTTLF